MDPVQSIGTVDRFGSPADLDAPRAPGRKDLIDNDRGATVAGHIAKLLGVLEVAPADLISRARESTVVITDFSSLDVEQGDRNAALRELGDRFGQSRGKVAALALVDPVARRAGRSATGQGKRWSRRMQCARSRGRRRRAIGELLRHRDTWRAASYNLDEQNRQQIHREVERHPGQSRDY
ncbi:MAG: hypothetical protein ACR2GX_01025 [Candidatus Dormibacteria bacterium]